MAQGSSVAGGEDSSVARPNRRDSEEVERMGSHELYSDSLEKAAEQNSGGYFGAVNIYNSEDVLVGNKAVLNGDVTINQYIYPNGIKEINPLTDHLAKPEDVTICTKNGNIKLNNGKKPHPVVQITQQNSIEKGLVREWWRWMSCTFAGALMVVLVLLFAWWWLRSFGDDPQKAVASPKQYPFVIPDNLTDDKVVLSNALHFVERDEWLALDPVLQSYMVMLNFPIPYVVIHQTDTQGCFSNTECMKLMRNIQQLHISKGYGDIGYNFVIGGDGYVYVGRSWGYMGAHTFPYNRCTIGIAFIGSYEKDDLNEDQLKALQLLLYLGVKTKKISEDYRLYSGSKINVDNSGENLIKRLESFPHYSTKNIHDCSHTNLNISAINNNKK